MFNFWRRGEARLWQSNQTSVCVIAFPLKNANSIVFQRRNFINEIKSVCVVCVRLCVFKCVFVVLRCIKCCVGAVCCTFLVYCVVFSM